MKSLTRDLNATAIMLGALALVALAGAGAALPLGVLVRHAQTVAIVAIFIGAATVIGWQMARPMLGREADRRLMLAWSIGLGLYLQSILVWTIARNAMLATGIFIAEVVVALLLLRGAARLLPAQCAGCSVRFSFTGVVALLLALPVASFWFTPPFSYDVLEYHLGGPVGWLGNGTAPIQGNFYTGLPSALEFQYTFLLYLARGEGFVAAKLLHGFYFLLYCWLSLELWRRMDVERPARWAGVICLLAFQPLFQTSVDANNDMAAAAIFLLAVLTWVVRRSVPLAFFALGMAAGYKFSILSLGLSSMAVFVAFYPRATGDTEGPTGSVARRAIGSLLLGAGAFLLGFSPWMLRSWFHYGEPFFPLTILNSLSEAGMWSWSSVQASAYAAHHLQAMPWITEYWERIPAQVARLGWLFGAMPVLGLIGAALSAGPRRRLAAAAALAGIAGLAAWNLLGTSPTRFIIPIAPLMLGAVLLSASHVNEEASEYGEGAVGRRSAMWAVLAALVAAPALVSYWVTVDDRDAMAVAISHADGAAFVEREMQGWAEAGVLDYFERIAESARDDQPTPKLLAVFEARTAHLPLPAQTVTVHDPWPPAWQSLGDLRAAGFSHLLVNELELERLREFYPPRLIEGVSEDEAVRFAGASPSDIEFYRSWGPWLLGRAIARRTNRVEDYGLLVIDEIHAARATPTQSSGDLTSAGHRVWILDLREYLN